MTRRRIVPIAPGQLALNELLRDYPEAVRIVPTRTGWLVAVLEGGGPEPTPARKVRVAA